MTRPDRDDGGALVVELFPDALWAHDLIEWAAQLELAVTHLYELAVIERYAEPAGAVLLDQLAGLPCGTAADVKARWPTIGCVFFATDPVFGEAVEFVKTRAATLRDTAYAMATTAVFDHGRVA